MKKLSIIIAYLLFCAASQAQEPIISPTVIAPAGTGGALSNGWFVEYTVGESYVAVPSDSIGIGFRHGVSFDTVTPRVDFHLSVQTSIYTPKEPISIISTLANATIESWIVQPGTLSGNITDKTISVTFADTGSYDVSIIYLTPWGSTDTILKKNFIQIVKLIPADTIVCPGNEVVMQVVGPKMQSYTWNVGNGQSSLTTHPATTTDYQVTVTAPNGLQQILSSTVHVVQPIYLGIDQYKCSTGSVVIDAGVHEKYEWSNGSTTRSIEAKDLGMYSVTVTDVACSSSDQIAVLPNPYENHAPFIIAGDSIACEGDNKLYEVQDTSHALAKYYWTLYASGTNANKLQANDSLTSISQQWDKTGVDTLLVRRIEPNGCESQKSKIVKIGPKPTVDFAIKQITDDEYDFTNKSTQPELTDNGFSETLTANYGWQFVFAGDTTKEKAGFSKLHKTLPLGVNNVILKGENRYGCLVSTEKTLMVEISMSLYVPNAFSPENPNSGVALFQPKGCNLQEYYIEIYDIWGNLLWRSTKLLDGKIAEAWDGMYNGTPLKSDTYIWIIEATFQNGIAWPGVLQNDGSYSKTGPLVLIR